jgi:uncharacterized protein
MVEALRQRKRIRGNGNIQGVAGSERGHHTGWNHRFSSSPFVRGIAMRFTLDSDLNSFSITSYGPDWVRVNQQEFRRSLIVTPERLVSDWPPQSFGDLVEAHFETIAGLKPEIVLLGTGNRQRFPRPALIRPLVERGVGVEVMDTAAACRTYNIIMLEGRRVAAALLLRAD